MFTLVLMIIVSKNILDERKRRENLNYKFFPNDIEWNISVIIKYSLVAFFAGLMAGFLGIGGGLIIGPLLLAFGVHPIISVSTSNFIVIFTSSSTTTQFIILGLLNLNYGIACIAFSVIGSMIGSFLILDLVKRTGRVSILVFIIALVILLSAFLLPINSVLELIRDSKRGKNVWEFQSFC